ncbi:immunity protein Imm33 domain-containing protein [Arthrobacter sp. SD76]
MDLAQPVPQKVPYVALPAGWRFVLAPGHEDVWFDESC